MKYLKVWTDFESVLEPLEFDEIGRLFLAMLHYAATGEEPSDFEGNEVYLWRVAKRDIDNAAEEAMKNSRNGSKGGRPKKPTETEENQLKPTETEENQQKGEKKRKEKKGKENKYLFINEDEATEINAEQNKVLDAAELAGFPRNDATRAKLIALYADHGLQKMLEGIASCVDHSASSIAYLSAVLKGEPKKQTKTVAAQDYTQRDYSDEQAEAMQRMIRGVS